MRLCVQHLFSQPVTVSVDFKLGHCHNCQATVLDGANQKYCMTCSHSLQCCAMCGVSVSATEPFDSLLALRQCVIECKKSTHNRFTHSSSVVSLVFEPLILELQTGVISSLEQLNNEYILKMTRVLKTLH